MISSVGPAYVVNATRLVQPALEHATARNFSVQHRGLVQVLEIFQEFPFRRLRIFDDLSPV
jgi:hypothetical protein